MIWRRDNTVLASLVHRRGNQRWDRVSLGANELASWLTFKLKETTHRFHFVCFASTDRLSSWHQSTAQWRLNHVSGATRRREKPTHGGSAKFEIRKVVSEARVKLAAKFLPFYPPICSRQREAQGSTSPSSPSPIVSFTLLVLPRILECGGHRRSNSGESGTRDSLYLALVLIKRASRWRMIR
jgi:hypothetical protein